MSNLQTFIFCFNSRITCWMLISACLFILLQYFTGYGMQCLFTPSKGLNVVVLNFYCRSVTTYPVNASYLQQALDVAQPDIKAAEKSEYEYRSGFVDVPIALCIQAILFYIPYGVWKAIERSFLSEIPEEICSNLFTSEKESTESLHVLFNYSSYKSLLDAVGTSIVDKWGSHKLFAFKYFMCEVLATINVLGQKYLLDVFFYGKFLGLWFGNCYNSEFLTNPVLLFPPATICSFPGVPGFTDPYIALCILPMNHLNAKIILFIWLWITTLCTLAIFSHIYFAVCMIIPLFRISPLKIYCLLCKPFDGKYCYEKLVILGNFGDWFVLSCLKRKINRLFFNYITSYVHSEITIPEN